MQLIKYRVYNMSWLANPNPKFQNAKYFIFWDFEDFQFQIFGLGIMQAVSRGYTNVS